MSRSPYIEAAEELRGNEGQWQAYEAQGNCAILAGPGSGKTKTITTKIARILEEEIHRPQRLACITYSNECVRELRKRLSKLRVDDPSRILVSTIHSFALCEVVIPFAAMAGIPIPSPMVVATPKRASELVKQAHQNITGRTPKGDFRLAFDCLRRTVPDRASPEWSGSNKLHVEIIHEHERLLFNEGLIDFDGIVLSALQAIEGHEWVRTCLRSKFPVVVIDEYQDLGVPLHKMVCSLMTQAGVRIIAVGDPNQSIYGFTGARPGLLRELYAMESVERIPLKLNYRCANEIIDASKTLLKDPLESAAVDEKTGVISIHRVGDDLVGQARFAFDNIVPSLLKAHPEWQYGDIAFLYRSARIGAAIAQVAEELGIRYFRLDNGVLVKHTRLVQFLTDAAKWCAGGWKDGSITLAQLLKSWRVLRPGLKDDASIQHARLPLIRVLFDNRDGSQSLRVWLNKIFTSALKDAFATEGGLADERENLKELYALTNVGKPFATFTVEIFANQGRSVDQLNLITLHSSKGLEFEVVIMPGLEDGEFPLSFADPSEEERLFYVGITRAKSEVHLLYERNESSLVTTIRNVAS